MNHQLPWRHRHQALKQFQQETALALLELALVVPVILFIGLIGYDIARVFHVKKMAQSLSREIAATAYRECPSLTIIDAGVTEENPRNCLDAVGRAFYQYAQSLSSEPTIIISFYNNNGLDGGGACSTEGASCRVSRIGDKNKYSQYGRASVKAMLGSVADKNTLLIAEVYLEYTSFFGFNIFDLLDAGKSVKDFTPWVPENTSLYDVTLI